MNANPVSGQKVALHSFFLCRGPLGHTTPGGYLRGRMKSRPPRNILAFKHTPLGKSSPNQRRGWVMREGRQQRNILGLASSSRTSRGLASQAPSLNCSPPPLAKYRFSMSSIIAVGILSSTRNTHVSYLEICTLFAVPQGTILSTDCMLSWGYEQGHDQKCVGACTVLTWIGACE